MKKTKDTKYFEHHDFPKKHDVVETDEFVIIDGFKVNYVTKVKEKRLSDSLHEVTVKFIAKSFKQK